MKSSESHEPSYYEVALTNRQVLIAFVVQAAIGPALAWMEAAQGLSRAGAHQVVTFALLAMQAAIWAWYASSREARDLP